MKKILWAGCFTIVSLAFSSSLLAQLSDDFSDGNFTESPTWSGNISSFVVFNSQLRLQAPEENGISYLSTASRAIKNATWEASITFAFNPSGSNYARIYLAADSSDLSGSLHGYFVLVGGTNDEVSLYRQSGGSSTAKIIDGRDKILDFDSVNVGIKVTRDNEGNWELFSKVGTADYTSEGSVYDDVYASPSYFGIYCKYTSTRSHEFYFDDVRASGEPNLDVIIQAVYKDVIVTEIFADPSPIVGLPAGEFLELLNRSSSPFKLSGWTISDGSTTGTLGSKMLQPGKYLILTATVNEDLFAAYGDVVGVSSFPSLNNSGDAIVLRSLDGVIIDSLKYSNTWYNDSEKKKGGWSLELIDPENVCGEKDNWTASENEIGGTPGGQNSVYANKPDLMGPVLTEAVALSNNKIRLQFNEKLALEDFQISDFNIEPAISLQDVSFTPGSLDKLDLITTDALNVGTLYTIAVQRVRDCNRNLINPDNSTEFAVPEKADSLDVVVNEILFNPFSGGVDFVEVYNRSSKFVDLKNWTVSNFNNGQQESIKLVTDNNLLLHPNQYLAFTSDPDLLMNHYPSGRYDRFYKMTLPSFPDDVGSVAIADSLGSIIDAFLYQESFHSPFIKNDEGVSLERVSPEAPTNEPQNWKSASTTVGYATPGYLNSNSTLDGNPQDDALYVDPEIFEPIYGQPNFTQIHYKLDKGGYVANAKVFDSQGRLIKILANNELLGAEGFYRWDGDRDDGNQARIGYYMVWFEIFDEQGHVKTYRRRVVIAAKF